MWDITD